MQDTALSQDLLGLQSPSTVSRVQLTVTGQSVDVWAEHPEDAAWACPHGTTTLPLSDHAEERTWRHLDRGQVQTHRHARLPRVACGEHGVVQVTGPWAEPRSRVTLLVERVAIDVRRPCDVSGATRIVRISWDDAWGLMQRAVRRGRARTQARIVRRIGVEEQAAATGHRDLTRVCDVDEGTVEHIVEDRTQESRDGSDAGLTKEQLDGIDAVAMDMWEPSSQATRAQGPEAAEKIVFDRVHVMGHVGKAVDTVRKQEHRELMASGDETLKGSTSLWLSSRENVPERRRDACEVLMRKEWNVGRAWAITEAVRRLWHDVAPASGWTCWTRWYCWATHSRLEPIRKAAETVRRHIDTILTYDQHPVTNAMSEGLNSKIQKIKSMACGFRNMENFKTAIYFRCGGLELYPC